MRLNSAAATVRSLCKWQETRVGTRDRRPTADKTADEACRGVILVASSGRDQANNTDRRGQRGPRSHPHSTALLLHGRPRRQQTLLTPHSRLQLTSVVATALSAVAMPR